MMDGNNHGRVIIISGFAGSGKTVVLEELLKLADYKISVSATARKPRVGEVHGVNYYFMTKAEFDKRTADGEWLEYAEFSGNWYATPLKPVEETIESGRDIILEIEVQGASNVRKKYPDALTIFIAPPSYKELQQRLGDRGTETAEEIQKRLKTSKEEINHIYLYDYYVINETGKQAEATATIHAIISGEDSEIVNRCKVEKEKIDNFIAKYFE